MSAFIYKYFTKIKLMGEELMPECNVHDPQWRRLKLKHACQLLVCAATDHQQQVAHRQYKFIDGRVMTVVEVAPGKGHA